MIFLCGFMASGKTTLGKVISQKLNYPFLDLDQEIESKTNMTINQIFKQQGEPQFRLFERQLIFDILEDKRKNKNTIVALGGGSIQTKNTLNQIQKNHHLIFVDIPFDICFHRIINSTRPYAFYQNREKCNIKKYLWSLYFKRYPLYKKSHIIVSPSPGEEISEIADKIIPKIQ